MFAKIEAFSKKDERPMQYRDADIIVRRIVHNEDYTLETVPVNVCEETHLIMSKMLAVAMMHLYNPLASIADLPQVGTAGMIPDDVLEQTVQSFVNSYSDDTCNACDHPCATFLNRDLIAQAARAVFAEMEFNYEFVESPFAQPKRSSSPFADLMDRLLGGDPL